MNGSLQGVFCLRSMQCIAHESVGYDVDTRYVCRVSAAVVCGRNQGGTANLLRPSFGGRGFFNFQEIKNALQGLYCSEEE